MVKGILEDTKPALPDGFSVRPLKMEDVDELAEMFNEAAVEMLGHPDASAEELRTDFQSPGLDLEKDTRVVFSPEGKLVAYQDVFALHKTPVYPFVWGRVHLDYHGMGLGTYLLDWGMQRAHHVLDKVPGDARVAVRSYNPSTWEQGEQLLKDKGMKVNRHFFEMVIDMEEVPPKPQWPEGITVRKYNHPEEAEEVYKVIDNAFRDHFGYVEEPFEEGFERFQHFRFNDETFDPDLWFLAVEGEEIVGLSLCSKWSHEGKQTGMVSILGVRRPWRKRGIGLALLLHSFNAYWQRNQKRVKLGVDAGNLTGAVRLYEKAGMHVQKRFDGYELELRPGRELSIVEIGE